jgi:translation initiation factor IF-1
MNEEEDCSGDMNNSLKIALDDIVIVERTKLNPKLSSKKKRISEQQVDGYINTIKLASKGYKADLRMNAEDRKVIESMMEKKEKKKGWVMLCC